jgi:predicted small metal-binding protein
MVEMPNEESMLIQYTCKDMGLKCTFRVKGETEEEVVKQALTHVVENHSLVFNNIHTPDEVTRMERALARSTRIIAD